MNLQNGNTIRFLHGHIVVSGIIFCKSGIFIGGPDDTLQIGGIDKSVIRNPLTGEPYIPGSSLKGKLRSITEKIISPPLVANRWGGDKQRKVWRHECNDYVDSKDCQLCRIFGATGSEANNNYPGALLVRDSTLATDKLMQDGLAITETKMENAIDRLTSAAHPRTFERVPAEAEFEFELLYRVETFEPSGIPANGKVTVDSARVKADITHLHNAMEILEKDGLGGNISRGYGSVEFEVEEFRGYKIKEGSKSGIKIEKEKQRGKPLSECKGVIKDIIKHFVSVEE